MQIISQIATERRVEKMVATICHKDLDADLKDLCQMVYQILLEYDDDKIIDLWANGRQMDYFLARIIVNQYKSDRSTWYWTICRFRSKSVCMGVGADITDKRIEWLNEQQKKK